MDRLFFNVKYRRDDADRERIVRVEAANESEAAAKIAARGHQVLDTELVEIVEGISLASTMQHVRSGVDARLGEGYGKFAVPALAVVSALIVVWAIVD